MATADEILEAMAAEEEERVLVIDNDLRTITIPGSVRILGVESDDEVNRIPFRMPRMYGEFDLSAFELRINYLNAEGKGDVYEVTDAVTSDDVIEFSWLVGRFAAKRAGSVQFIVCAKMIEDSEVIREFNTSVASLPVLRGIEAGEAVVQQNPDIIESILLRLSELESSGGTGGAQINDSATSASSTWSSRKISTEISGIELTQGPTGPAGYTPVRGTDYWTEADQEQIVNDVLGAIQTGGSGESSDWELLGEVTSDGAGDATGIKVPVVVADYRALFIEAGPKTTDVNLRVKLCPSNTAWWSGYGLIMDTMARTHRVQCFVMNFSGKLRAFVGAQDGWDTMTSTQYQIPMYPSMSPREEVTTDAGYQYIVVDTGTSTGVVPEGLVLTVYGMK